MKERHAQILEAIKSFYQENGFCPTIRQIGGHNRAEIHVNRDNAPESDGESWSDYPE